jgi:hypothetical protein
MGIYIPTQPANQDEVDLWRSTALSMVGQGKWYDAAAAANAVLAAFRETFTKKETDK